MRFPKHWTKAYVPVEDSRGKAHEFAAWGWSDVSMADAEEMARRRAASIGRRVLDDDPPEHYTMYARAPLREQVVRAFGDPGAPHSAVTINVYGCEVLNSTQLMFVDIDLRPVSSVERVVHLVRRLMGGKPTSVREKQEARFLVRLEGLAGMGPSRAVRVYRTRAGLRYLFWEHVPPPGSQEAAELMERLGADPLYMRLCKAQESYRARLTPKPWRCGMRAARVEFPWLDEAKSRAYEEWQQEYETVSRRYATCEFLAGYGDGAGRGDRHDLVALHDAATRATSGLPLA